ncbi:HD domain protein [Candidatus Gugararchaeum adminiculabundum]|nr:HD domain protein [Candidatus Gugararchaeum adminiculabundum]
MAKPKEKEMAALANLFFEAGQLKRLPRSGWLTIGIKDCETIAEHSFRSALISYVLAKMEGVDYSRILLASLVHDLHEARISDLNTTNKKYVKADERKAWEDALAGLPGEMRMEIESALDEKSKNSIEAKICNDADKLEMLVQAKEYLDLGHRNATDWIASAQKNLRTNSAKRLAKIILRMDSNNWLLANRNESKGKKR